MARIIEISEVVLFYFVLSREMLVVVKRGKKWGKWWENILEVE